MCIGISEVIFSKRKSKKLAWNFTESFSPISHPAGSSGRATYPWKEIRGFVDGRIAKWVTVRVEMYLK